jgi:hypothetical protein
MVSPVGVALINNCMANNSTAVKNLLKENAAGEVVKYQNQHGETALHVSFRLVLWGRAVNRMTD